MAKRAAIASALDAHLDEKRKRLRRLSSAGFQNRKEVLLCSKILPLLRKSASFLEQRCPGLAHLARSRGVLRRLASAGTGQKNGQEKWQANAPVHGRSHLHVGRTTAIHGWCLGQPSPEFRQISVSARNSSPLAHVPASVLSVRVPFGEAGDVLSLTLVATLSTADPAVSSAAGHDLGGNRPSEAAETSSAEALMALHAEGEPGAFEELYRLTSSRLFGYLLRLTRQRERAEDLVQITFAKVHRARHSYLTGAPVLPWILAIARRSFLDERRRHKVRPEDLTVDGTTPEPGPSPEAIGNDIADALERAMHHLPGKYSEAIQLTKFTGLTTTQAAEVLGTTQTAVKLRVHRGYALLRKELSDYGRDL